MTDKPIPDFTLDARGLQCPMPILKAKKEIQKLEIGQILEVISNDPGSKEDFPRWAKRTGNELLGIFDENDFSRYFVKRLG
ncbi:MAG TPA: sulfurtransferase TusA family protein [candidate division Zixibacteria bacterium]|nr:sulfurtransferase TusA family protein [candidate division Zixibacteria bacterium]